MAQTYTDPSNPDKIYNESGEDVTDAANSSSLSAFLWGADKTLRNVANYFVDTPDPSGRPNMGHLRQTHPMATWLGETAPGMIGPTGAGLKGQAVYSAITGALMAPEGERASGAGFGLAGAGVGAASGEIIGRVANAWRAAGVDLAEGAPEYLTKQGYKLTPAQKSGSQAAMKTERGIEKNPWMQKSFGKIGAHNQELLTRRMNDAVGLEGYTGPLNREARTAAAGKIGDTMDLIADGVEMEMPEGVAQRISRVLKSDDMLEIPEIPAGGAITGTDYMRIRSDLARAGRSAQGSAGDYISKTIDQMDDEFLRVVGPEQAAAYRVAREQYKNLSLLEKGKAVSSDGEINILTAGNNFRNRQGYGPRSIDNTLPQTKQLIDDLDNLSGKAVNPYVGNSGTPEGVNRQWSPSAILNGIGNAGYLGGKQGTGGLINPATALDVNLGANIGRGLLTDDRE